MSTAEAAQGGFAARPLYAPPKELAAPGSSSSSTPTTRRPFDENDPSVYFDRQSGRWRCESDAVGEDAVELEWEAPQQAWLPVLDDDLVRAQQAAYSVDGVDEETPAAPVLRRQKRRQRSPAGNNDAGTSNAGARPANKARKRVNTSVYITGLPLDCDKEEIAHVFSRYGVLNEDDAGEVRIKMYADERTGTFKGEALVTYFKEESVELAIRVLDESPLRAAEGKMLPVMRVMQAEFGGSRGDKNVEMKEVNTAIHAATQQQPQTSSRPPPSDADKRRAAKRYAKMNNKLLDWDSDSADEYVAEAPASGSGTRNDAGTGEKVRQVCLRRMFTIAGLEEDPSLLLDLKADVREECESLGKVTNVVLWDKEPEGIMTVKFADHEAALNCVEKMNLRYFDGRQVIAHLLAGKPRFRRSGKGRDETGNDDDDDDDENGNNTDEGRRKDAFGEWLEAESLQRVA